MWKGLGTHTKGRVWADASAALGMVGGKGLGKVRHLDASVLWVQDASLEKKILYGKVAGEWSIADRLIKHLDAETSAKHSEAIGVEFKEGASRIAIGLNSVTARGTGKTGTTPVPQPQQTQKAPPKEGQKV
jgi:hypothetical protein